MVLIVPIGSVPPAKAALDALLSKRSPVKAVPFTERPGIFEEIIITAPEEESSTDIRRP